MRDSVLVGGTKHATFRGVNFSVDVGPEIGVPVSCGMAFADNPVRSSDLVQTHYFPMPFQYPLTIVGPGESGVVSGATIGTGSGDMTLGSIMPPFECRCSKLRKPQIVRSGVRRNANDDFEASTEIPPRSSNAWSVLEDTQEMAVRMHPSVDAVLRPYDRVRSREFVCAGLRKPCRGGFRRADKAKAAKASADPSGSESGINGFRRDAFGDPKREAKYPGTVQSMPLDQAVWSTSQAA